MRRIYALAHMTLYTPEAGIPGTECKNCAEILDQSILTFASGEKDGPQNSRCNRKFLCLHSQKKSFGVYPS